MKFGLALTHTILWGITGLSIPFISFSEPANQSTDSIKAGSNSSDSTTTTTTNPATTTTTAIGAKRETSMSQWSNPRRMQDQMVLACTVMSISGISFLAYTHYTSRFWVREVFAFDCQL